MFLIFFFKQKTAYEMRISDWSSDVCSSDLGIAPGIGDGGAGRALGITGQGTAQGAAGIESVADIDFGALAVEVGRRAGRSEERRVGKEGGSRCSSRWSPYN